MSSLGNEQLRVTSVSKRPDPENKAPSVAILKSKRLVERTPARPVVPPPRVMTPNHVAPQDLETPDHTRLSKRDGESDNGQRLPWTINAVLAIAVLIAFSVLWMRGPIESDENDVADTLATQFVAHTNPIRSGNRLAGDDASIAGSKPDSFHVRDSSPSGDPRPASEKSIELQPVLTAADGSSANAVDLLDGSEIGPIRNTDSADILSTSLEDTARFEPMTAVASAHAETSEQPRSIDAESRQPDLAPGQEKPALPAIENNAGSDALVKSALQAELRGSQREREQYLASVLREDPAHAAANWQSGNIRMGGEWLDLAEAQERGKRNPVLSAYQRMRASNEGTPAGELILARWCKTRRPQASRMYYTRLIDRPGTSPSVRAEAAKHLDMVPFQGQYVTRSELATYQEQSKRFEAAYRKWDAAIDKWRKWLRPQSSDEQKQRATSEMREVDDPDIALVVNSYAATGSELFATRVVSMIERFPQAESSRCLAHYGIVTPYSRVRQDVVTALRDRKLHDYVPELMGSLIGRMESDGKIDRTDDGTIQFRHTFRQENARENVEKQTSRDARPIVNFEPRFFDRLGREVTAPRIDPAGNGLDIRLSDSQERTEEDLRVRREFQSELARREQATRIFNANAERTNQRICSLLADTTDHELHNEPKLWWDWWKEYNGIDFQKSHRRYLDEQNFTYVALNAGPRYQRRHSCFAAGTPVATETGMRPIEQILPGDRVFAKDALSGELKLQTVLVTTLRPATELVDVTIDGEVIRTTPGHPFWVTGEGWRMAQLLEEGDQLHGMHGLLNVEKIERIPVPEPVHNLIVDEFSNYFAGRKLSLVHDNTFRRPAAVSLPGLPVRTKEHPSVLP
ncbi:MAG: polymorphic toxin-type HINT domain-containing protein [Planctomycetota bacterium]